MRKELLNKLQEKYPKIFVAGCPSVCGDGWYEIIDSLCGIIQSRCDFRNIIVNESKYPIGHRLHMQTECTGCTHKRNSIQFSIKDGDSFIDGAVQMAEDMIAKVKQ